MSHEKVVEPFSDLHVEDGGHIRATLLHAPNVEGLDTAIYIDGSGSMQEEYGLSPKTVTKTETKTSHSLWRRMFGMKPKQENVEVSVEEPGTNEVEPQVQWMLEYLATKDRNGLLRVAYWACGDGRGVEAIGELKGIDVKQYKFPGPSKMGNGTHLAPAMRDYLSYFRGQIKEGAKRGCAVFVTDGQLSDAEDVKRYSKELAQEMINKTLPRIDFILVGIGDAINEEQLESISHEEYEGIGHLWCHRIAAEITQVAELVATLVDETMTVAGGGIIYDDKNNVIKRYEGSLPAVLEFQVPDGTKSFTLEVNGQRFTQPIPEEEEHH